MMASPNAMSSSTVNRLRPEKPCIATIEPISFRLIPIPSSLWRPALTSDVSTSRVSSLIALGKRIRLDQIRVVDELELAVGFGFANPRFAPQVMVLVDLHVAFGSDLDLDVRRSSNDLVDVEAARFFDGSFPDPGAEVTGLSHVADHALFTPHLLERLDESLVVRVVETLEVLHRREEPGQILATDAEHFVFGHGDGE